MQLEHWQNRAVSYLIEAAARGFPQAVASNLSCSVHSAAISEQMLLISDAAHSSDRDAGCASTALRTASDAEFTSLTLSSLPALTAPPMKIIMHEMATYGQNQQLAKALASRGHDIIYAYCPSFLTPSRSSTHFSPAEGVTAVRVELGAEFTKRNFLKRFLQERAYGTKMAAMMASLRPDLIISGNTPIEVQSIIQKMCRRLNTPFVLWMHDVYSTGVKSVLARAPLIGDLVAQRYALLEHSVARRSEGIVTISADFRDLIAHWGVDADRVTVVENWGVVPSGALPRKDNDWAARHGLLGKRVLLYSGTLGFKHNPQVLLDLASEFRDDPDVRVVVISEGYGAEWLSLRRKEFPGLVVLPFQSEEDFQNALAAADILIAILEPEAAKFSVPGKVLSYMSAGKPILGAISEENLAARTVLAASAGMIADPTDPGALRKLARLLVDDKNRCLKLGTAALDYARTNFEIGAIARRFEDVFYRAVERGTDSRTRIVGDAARPLPEQIT